jgi:subfamily B ATP-binding cassette protein MsbA
MLRNVASTMTGTSSLSGFASLVIGAVGVLAFLVGGRAIVAGEMTVGDLLRYIMFTAYLTMPIFQLASIGTQITEAFAGLDRIREILDVARGTRTRRSTEIGTIRGEVAFRDVWFEYNEGVPVIKNVSFQAPPG